MNITLTIDVKGEILNISRLILHHLIVQGKFMTAQYDAIKTGLDKLQASNAALVSLTGDLKAKLDAALAAGTGLTAAEVQQLSDQIAAVQQADDAAVAADTPAAPAPAAPTA